MARLRGVGLDELAQAHHLHIDAAVGGRVVRAIGQCDEPVAAQGPVRLLCQRLQQREFARGQGHVLGAVAVGAPVAFQPALIQPQRERAKIDAPARLARPGVRTQQALAAHHGLDAGQQLARVEGLGQVVVGAHLQAHDAVHGVSARGEHQDGDGLALRAQAAADGQAILARHHHVEHQHVKALALQQHIDRARTIDRAHAVALVAQVALQQRTQVGFVIGDQDLGQGFRHGAVCGCGSGWVQPRLRANGRAENTGCQRGKVIRCMTTHDTRRSFVMLCHTSCSGRHN